MYNRLIEIQPWTLFETTIECRVPYHDTVIEVFIKSYSSMSIKTNTVSYT